MSRANKNSPKKKKKLKKSPRQRDPSVALMPYLSGFNPLDANKVFKVALEVFTLTKNPDAAVLAFQASINMPDPCDAANAFSQIAALAPSNSDIQNDFGALLCRSNRFEEAEEVLLRALNFAPGDGQILFNMAQALMGQNRFSDAEAVYRKSIEHEFLTPMVFAALGDALREQGKISDAIEYFKKAYHLDRSNSDFRDSYEKALWDSGTGFPELERIYVADLVNDSEKFSSAMQLACVYSATERLSRARSIIDQWLPKQEALKIEDQAQLREILSELQCLEGDFKHAMHNYHWRLKRWKRGSGDLKQPEWSGESLNDKSILVYAEQGIGDQIMFMSLLPDLMTICDRIFVECDARLVSLFRRSFSGVDFFPVENIGRIEMGERKADFQIAMGSLGCWLWDSFERKKKTRYLFADGKLTSSLRSRYLKGRGMALVGASWSSPLGKFPGLKSIEISDLLPLFRLKNTCVVDLQYGETVQERTEFESRHGVSLLHDVEIDQLVDIDSFSAQVAAMDIILTVSNSVAHLAGALGVPTVVLLPSAPQWKWSGSDQKSVWYPNVQLVRRTIDDSVEGQVAAALKAIGCMLQREKVLQ